jgi:sulfur carrier protein
MNIHINGKAYSLGNKISITVALTYHFTQPQQSTFAVALNGDFVGKADYDTIMLKQGDSLDVLQPIQGG